MSPASIAHAVRVRLAAELAGDRAALGRLAASIEALTAAAPADATTATMRALALAFQLERFYTSVEALLTRTLRTLDGDVPSGGDWHSELLRASAVAVEGLRPAVVPAEAVAPLRELLGFRHFARHGYDVEPEARRLEELASAVARVFVLLDPAIAAFEASLKTAAVSE